MARKECLRQIQEISVPVIERAAHQLFKFNVSLRNHLLMDSLPTPGPSLLCSLQAESSLWRDSLAVTSCHNSCLSHEDFCDLALALFSSLLTCSHAPWLWIDHTTIVSWTHRDVSHLLLCLTTCFSFFFNGLMNLFFFFNLTQDPSNIHIKLQLVDKSLVASNPSSSLHFPPSLEINLLVKWMVCLLETLTTCLSYGDYTSTSPLNLFNSFLSSKIQLTCSLSLETVQNPLFLLKSIFCAPCLCSYKSLDLPLS